MSSSAPDGTRSPYDWDGPLRQCSGPCREWWPIGAFDANGYALYTGRKRGAHSVCRPCRQHARDAAKEARRSISKASSAIAAHAKKYIALGWAKDRVDFVERYGWDVHRMAHDIDHAFGNGCGYCGKKFADMPHGLANVTIDVQDPKTPPWYRTNCRWVCRTCNTKKGKATPERFEFDQVLFPKWEAARAREWPSDSLFAADL